MRNFVFASVSLLAIFVPLVANADSNPSGSGVIVIEGKYQNKNLYIQNSFASSGVGFCVFEVMVNGRVTTDPVNSSAFEIDFSSQMISPGTDVVVQIKHKPGCTPKVLNPDVLKPMPTFETLNIKVTPEGIINWQTKGETGSLPFVVEQFKWNKWVPIGEVQGSGITGESNYSFKATLVSGENKFRVRQTGSNRKARYSPEAKVIAKAPKVGFNYNKNTRELTFDQETSYEIFDKYGNLVKKGFGTSVNCSNLAKDLHYLNYDSETTELQLK
jgi:hypothetical protein